jgi:hypothetical protein
MSPNTRPLAVTLVGWLYLGVGAIGFLYHLSEFGARNASRYEDVWIELVRFLAIISGAFMLRGHNWARWLALAWILFHLVLSAFHSFREFAIHCLFCAVIGWILLRSDASRYFRFSS